MTFSFNNFATGLAAGLSSNPAPIGSFGRGFTDAYNAVKSSKNKEAEQNAVKKIMAGDESGWEDWAQVNPEAAYSAMDKKKRWEAEQAQANQLTPYQQAMIELKEKEIQAMKDSGKYTDPYTRTVQIEEAKHRAELEQKIRQLESGIPEFQKMADKLNSLGEKATYTWVGKGLDSLARQVKWTTEGAKAREEYKQTVANELLPTLRDTFGSQLSDQERESLLSTLGNEDLSEKEKKAAVDSFMEAKKRQLKKYKDQLRLYGVEVPEQQTTVSLSEKYGLEE